MSTLGIFTVKIFHLHGGRYFTNGGFGKYLSAISAEFDTTILVCKLKRAPPPTGFYLVNLPNLIVVGTPAWPSELGALAAQPVVFLKGLDVARRADVVHARMPDWSGITGALAARSVGTPCFHQIVDDWRGLRRTIPPLKYYGLGTALKVALSFYEFLELRVSRDQLVFAQGQTAYDKHEAAAERVLMLSTAHSLTDIGEVKPKFGKDHFTILNVARMNSVKNQQLLVRALSILRQKDQRWRLRIVGEGPKRFELEQLARTLRVADAIDMPGLVEHGPDLWAEYDAADVFALSSVSEGTPKVILEAMARGCPVVASAVSGVPTAVKHEHRGLLYASQDARALANTLERISSDHRLRARCQETSLAFARANTIELSTQAMLAKVRGRWPHLAPLSSHHA